MALKTNLWLQMPNLTWQRNFISRRLLWSSHFYWLIQFINFFFSQWNMQKVQQPKLTSAAGLVRKLHDLASEFNYASQNSWDNWWIKCILSVSKLLYSDYQVSNLIHVAVQKKGYMDLQEMAREDSILFSYGNSLQKDPTCTLPCSWSAGNPSAFLIRGKNYLKDSQKVFIHFSFVFKM